jgi:nitrate reductase assembly molybdenum cofactor insertion protein NarJ
MGEKFGYLAGSNQVATYYNKWSNAMAECLRDANECFSSLASALMSAANTYDAADASVASEGSSLESRLGRLRDV